MQVDWNPNSLSLRYAAVTPKAKRKKKKKGKRRYNDGTVWQEHGEEIVDPCPTGRKCDDALLVPKICESDGSGRKEPEAVKDGGM